MKKIILLILAVFILCGFTASKEFKVIKADVASKVKIPKWYHEGLYFDGRNIWVNNGEKGNTWIVDPASGSVIKEIKPIGTFTETVTAKDKDTFFATDWYTKKIYKARVENDTMIAESGYSTAPAHPAGAAWTGDKLFVVTWTRSIAGTRFHLLKLDGNLNLLNTTEIKNITEPTQLAWDGFSLWVSCWYSRRVYKVDPEKGEILGYFKSPAPKTTGIAWDGKNMWLTGTYAWLYKMNIKNGG